MAEKNAARHLHDSKLNCICADFTAPDFLLPEKADVIVSNPPYVLAEEHADLDRSVRDFEPRLALVAEEFEQLLRALIATAFRNLAVSGLFALETHPMKSSEVARWVTDAGFAGVEIRNDFSGRPHFVFGRSATP
jgi:release factor glutamine methyltransferase